MPILDDLKQAWSNLTTPPQPTNINVQIPQPQDHTMSDAAMGIGGMTAAGGAATNFAGNNLRSLGLQGSRLLTPQGRSQLQQFLSSTSDNVPEAQRMANFVNHSHDLLNTDVFRLGNSRMTGYDAMDSAYQNKGVESLIRRINPNYNGMTDATRQHYAEFAKGPLQGYRQLLTEQLGHNPNAYMDGLHELRLSALNNMRSAGGRGFYQQMANILKQRANPSTGLRPDMSPAVQGDQYFSKTLGLESKLRQADPAAYKEWMRVGRQSNVGGPLDEGALSTLRSTGQHLYGKANVSDIVNDGGGFMRTLMPGMKQMGLDHGMIQRVMSTGDLSQIPIPLHKQLVQYLSQRGAPMQTGSVASDIAKSFSGPRMAYRAAAGGALKMDELAGNLAHIGKGIGRFGKAGLIGGAGLAATGLLGRLFGGNTPPTNYQLSIPPGMH